MAELSLNKIDKETGEIAGTMNLEIRVYPIENPKGNTKAYASITIDGLFGAHGVSVIEGKNGLFMQMPQTRDGQGKYRDIFHPVTTEGRAALQEAVLAEYGVAVDAMVAQKESTLQKLRESATAAKGKASPAPAKGEKAVRKAGQEH